MAILLLATKLGLFMDILDESAINIYTDGSSYSGPRSGGVGIRFITVGDDGHEVVEDHAFLATKALLTSKWN